MAQHVPDPVKDLNQFESQVGRGFLRRRRSGVADASPGTDIFPRVESSGPIRCRIGLDRNQTGDGEAEQPARLSGERTASLA